MRLQRQAFNANQMTYSPSGHPGIPVIAAALLTKPGTVIYRVYKE